MLLSLYFMLPSKSGCLLSEKLGQWGPDLNGWVRSQGGRQRGLALTHCRSRHGILPLPPQHTPRWALIAWLAASPS